MLYQKRVWLGVHTPGQSKEQDDQAWSLRLCFSASLHTPTGLIIDGLALSFELDFTFWSGLLGGIGACTCLSWHCWPTQHHVSYVIQLVKQSVQIYLYMFEQDGEE